MGNGNIFAKKKAVKGEKIEEDYVGGGGAVETDIYPAEIKYAYITKAANSKARGVTLCMIVNKKEITRTIWMTNRDGDVTYTDKKTKEEKNLPGYNQVNSLAMLVMGKDIGELDVEEKTLNIYDFEAKKEVATACDCFVELHKEKINVAIQKQTVDKTKKNDKTGDYDPTGETRDVNEFIKFFPEGGLFTLSEIKNYVETLGGDFDEVLADGDLDTAVSKMGDEHGSYATTWLDKNRAETWDRSSGKKKEGKAFKGGKGKSSEGGSEEKKKKSDLFDD